MTERQKYIIDIIMEQKDPDAAISALLSFYEDLQEDAVAIYSYWSSIRQEICRNDKYRDKYYRDRVMQIRRIASPDDQDLIDDLLSSPLHTQHRISIQRKPFLSNRSLDRELKKIKPVNQLMYQFKLPTEILECREDLMYERDQANQLHQLQNKETYHMSLSEANTLIDHCIAILHDDLETDKDYYNNVVALQILSGRRNFEILSTLEWFPSSHMYQCNVTGILKKRSVSVTREEEVYVIPLLCSYDLFSRAMQRLRDSKSVNGDCREVNSLAGPRILSASKRVAGRYLGHSQKRNIYSEMAWKRREWQNNYLTGMNSCSKAIWIQNALCHDFSITCTNRYQTMLIE